MPTPDHDRVSMLRAFGSIPQPAAEQLEYPKLTNEAKLARQLENGLMDDFWEAPTGSVEEEALARRLALGYLVLTGAQLKSTIDEHQDLVSRRFTQSSVELYGEPEPETVNHLLAEEAANFSSYLGNPAINQDRLRAVLQVYDDANDSLNSTRESREDYSEPLAKIREVIEARYGDALAVLDVLADENSAVQVTTVAELFNEVLEQLAKNNLDWQGWRAEITDGSGMSTDAENQVINIGNRGHYTSNRLKALFVHEALVHGLRSINGNKIDKKLSRGLPGNLDAEEGIAIFTEYAFTGSLPDRVVDRYIDVALALGSNNLSPMTRQQLHALHTNRLYLREQIDGQQPDAEHLGTRAWNHVNRIYRGSLGNETIGVNTKDVVYYQGVEKIAKYIASELALGIAPEDVFTYIMSGCFDPTNDAHRAYLEKKTKSAEA